MKVLLINCDCGVGSTGRICTDIASELMRNNHIVKIAYGRDSKQEYKDISIKIGSKIDVCFHGVLSRVFDLHGCGSILSTKKFIRWAEEFDPDLLWLHNIHGYYINYQILFSWIKSRPNMQVNWTLHDCWAFTGHCSYFTWNNCSKWKNGCSVCNNCKEYPSSLLFSNSKSNFAKKKKAFSGVNNMKIITPSVWLKGLVEESFLGNYPIFAVHNGIDTNIFRHNDTLNKSKYGIADDKKIILGVASIWNKRKGLDDFVRLADLLPDEYQVVVVGVNDKQKEMLPSKIIKINRTDSAYELAQLYSCAYVFFNPTYEDNYPTTNIEAIACGVPVITYRTGGSVESVPPQCVVNPGDIDAVLNIILSGNMGICSDIVLSKQEMVRELMKLI